MRDRNCDEVNLAVPGQHREKCLTGSRRRKSGLCAVNDSSPAPKSRVALAQGVTGGDWHPKMTVLAGAV